MADGAGRDRAGGQSPSLKERAQAWLSTARRRVPLLDHLIRTVQHYGAVKGTVQAGAVTFFAFLSFFPILALGFWAAGIVSAAYAGAEEAVTKAIQTVLPGLIGDGPGKFSLETVQQNAATAGIIGLAGVLFAGLGWLSGMRQALLVVFEKPQDEQPNVVVGKLKDLVSLTTIGLVLVVSVSLTGVVSGLSEQILDLVPLAFNAAPLLKLLGSVLGLLANMALFFALFRILANPEMPVRSLWQGALLGAIGFEVLKLVSSYLISSVAQRPAFAAFGISLILLVWINYFSRVVMLSAAWSYTSPGARRVRELAEAQHAAAPVLGPAVDVRALAAAQRPGVLRRWGVPFAAGIATTLAGVAARRYRSLPGRPGRPSPDDPDTGLSGRGASR